MAFLYALPGAVAEGLIWGLMAIGVYISYKILDIADLTTMKTGDDIYAIGEGVRKVYEEVLVPAGMGDVEIYTELGRYMMGPYGCLVTTAVHEKHIHKVIIRSGHFDAHYALCPEH